MSVSKDCNMDNNVNTFTRYEWSFVLPKNNDKFICSPKFKLRNIDVFYVVSVDFNDHYTIELYGEKLKSLSCNFQIKLVHKGSRENNMLTSSGRTIFNRMDLLEFDSKELRCFSFYRPYRQLTLIFKVNENEKRISKVNKSVQTNSYLNAGLYAYCLADDLCRYFNRGLNDGDVEVRCGDDVIKAHSYIFYSRSEVLKTMLYKDKMIKIVEMEVEYFHDFLDYLYTDMLPDLDFENAKCFYEIGDMYHIKNLMQRCGKYLTDILSPSNALECLRLADAHSDIDLKNSSKDFIISHEIFLDDDAWEPFSKQCPKIANEVLNKSIKILCSPQKKKYKY